MEEAYLEIFKEEADEHLKKLENLLLQLEREASPELVKEAKRSAHTIKGSARLIGLEEIGTLAHRMEDVFKAVEEGKKEFTREVVDALLKGIDALKKMVDGDQSLYDEAVKELEGVLEEKKNKLKEEAGKKKKRETSSREKSKGEPHEGKKVKESKEYFRVSADRIEKLINTAGEFLIDKIIHEGEIRNLENIPRLFSQEALKRFPEVSPEFVEEVSRWLEGKIREHMGRLGASMVNLASKVFEIQHEALSLKVVPFYIITDELKRYVRDTARSLNKSVNLIVEGEDVELDRKILDDLRPALMHVINNAITHGVEMPEERRRIGKPADGLVSIKVYPKGQNVVIEVMDDGRGIDVEKLKEKALEKGAIDEFQYESMSDDEAVNLVFLHGISTSESVSEISGRGVGMDVVKENVSRIGGLVRIDTQKGKYTKLTLEVPQTSAMMKVLWIYLGEEKVLLPVQFIKKVVRLKDVELINEGGRVFLNFEGGLIEVIDTLKVFNWGQYDSPSSYMVVLTVPTGTFAIFIDAFGEEEEVLVRSPGTILENHPLIAGVALGEDGMPHIIVDAFKVRELKEGLPGRGSGTLEYEFEEVLEKSRRRVLLVEDSPTILKFEKDVLEGAGFEVVPASDGQEGWEKFQEAEFDLVVTDIQMPRMDGLQLTSKIKSSKKPVPVVVVSALGSDEDIRRGMQAGADAYFVKKDFSPDAFLKKVRGLIR